MTYTILGNDCSYLYHTSIIGSYTTRLLRNIPTLAYCCGYAGLDSSLQASTRLPATYLYPIIYHRLGH